MADVAHLSSQKRLLVEQHLARPPINISTADHVTHQAHAIALLCLGHTKSLRDGTTHRLEIIRIYDQRFG